MVVLWGMVLFLDVLGVIVFFFIFIGVGKVLFCNVLLIFFSNLFGCIGFEM